MLYPKYQPFTIQSFNNQSRTLPTVRGSDWILEHPIHMDAIKSIVTKSVQVAFDESHQGAMLINNDAKDKDVTPSEESRQTDYDVPNPVVAKVSLGKGWIGIVALGLLLVLSITASTRK